MRVIYVAGPITADTAWKREGNIRKAEEAALEIWKMGAAAICPHTMCRFFQGELGEEEVLNGDFEILRRCDAVLFLPGWQTSPGSVREHRMAIEHNVPRLFSLMDVKRYLEWSPSGF